MSGYGNISKPLSKKSTVHRKSVQGVRVEAACPRDAWDDMGEYEKLKC